MAPSITSPAKNIPKGRKRKGKRALFWDELDPKVLSKLKKKRKELLGLRSNLLLILLLQKQLLRINDAKNIVVGLEYEWVETASHYLFAPPRGSLAVQWSQRSHRGHICQGHENWYIGSATFIISPTGTHRQLEMLCSQ